MKRFLSVWILSVLWMKSVGAASVEATYQDVKYGPYERNTMDVWLAPGETPRPCVMHIHGGGWLQGDKEKFTLHGGVRRFIENGISVVSVNYRYVDQTLVDSGSTRGTGPILPRGDYDGPPVEKSLMDIARALQFIRSKSEEWNIDPERIAVGGASAGACSSLWLAFHDDMADANASDPVARESTKPWCAAGIGAQTTLDPVQILEWIPNGTYGGHAFGYIWDKSDPTVEIRSFLADRENVLEWIQEYSPYSLVSRDDPPVYLSYGGVPEKGVEQKDAVHTANYGALLVEKLDEEGVQYEFVHKGVENPRFKNTQDYLIFMLNEWNPDS